MILKMEFKFLKQKSIMKENKTTSMIRGKTSGNENGSNPVSRTSSAENMNIIGVL